MRHNRLPYTETFLAFHGRERLSSLHSLEKWILNQLSQAYLTLLTVQTVVGIWRQSSSDL